MKAHGHADGELYRLGSFRVPAAHDSGGGGGGKVRLFVEEIRAAGENSRYLHGMPHPRAGPYAGPPHFISTLRCSSPVVSEPTEAIPLHNTEMLELS